MSKHRQQNREGILRNAVIRSPLVARFRLPRLPYYSHWVAGLSGLISSSSDGFCYDDPLMDN